jgi:hypothetical protein
MRSLRSLLRPLGLCGLILLPLACDSEPDSTTCVDVPDGGCPLDNGANVCQDPSCNAVYECSPDGGWILKQVCPAHPHDASTDAPDAADAGEGGSVFDVKIDVPPGGNGGPGCTDLEQPDCPAAEGIACVQMVGCCGCIDLWVCDNGGWDLWGECADGGITLQK